MDTEIVNPFIGSIKQTSFFTITFTLKSMWRPLSSCAAWFACLLIIVIGSAIPAAAQGQTRAVPSVGVMKDIPNAGEKPDPNLTYKIVFDVVTLAESTDEISPALQAMGGLINTYRAYGVPASHLLMTAVFHGPTILLVARDEIYRQRTGAATNPNAALLRELGTAGVQVVVCGQSAMSQHYKPADYLPAVQTNLSATITFLNLQTKGYVKLSE